MGISIFKMSSCSGLELKTPNPENFKIIRTYESDKYILAEILYPDCTNYEDKKVLLYETTLEKLNAQ
jgi:hypothetical protein